MPTVLSDAAKQFSDVGEEGGFAVQVPNGTSKSDVQDLLNRFRSVPGRDPKKYRNIYLEVRDESGNDLYNGGVF